jgi:SAM-dependent methyltransferase
MPIHVDVPTPGMEFNPQAFTVEGWLWLGEDHAQIASVEAWTGQFLLGTTTKLHLRDDINIRFGLPEETRTAFRISTRYHYAASYTNFDLRVHVRRRDGSLTDALFVSRIGPLPIAADPRGMLRRVLHPEARGLEIGAHTRPTPGIKPFYTDSVPDFAGTFGHLDFLSDACALPISDGTLDYLCCSHVLEHLPDPISALFEWHRVLGPGGLLYLVVPDKRYTFDAPRATTTTEHFLHDFDQGAVAATTVEHIDEFVFQSDWSLLHPRMLAADWVENQAAARADYLARLARGESIDIHFHTFTPESLRDMLSAFGLIGSPTADFAVVAEAERYPPERTDGIALLLRRRHPLRHLDYDNTCTMDRGPGQFLQMPLVDPVTLRPLPEDYLERFNGRWPDFRLPREVKPRRPWNTAWRRYLLKRRARLWIARSQATR